MTAGSPTSPRSWSAARSTGRSPPPAARRGHGCRGTVEQQCDPDEWLITIEDGRLAELQDGSPAPQGTPDDDLLFPQCYRDSSEIRAVPAGLQAG